MRSWAQPTIGIKSQVRSSRDPFPLPETCWWWPARGSAHGSSWHKLEPAGSYDALKLRAVCRLVEVRGGEVEAEARLHGWA